MVSALFVLLLNTAVNITVPGFVSAFWNFHPSMRPQNKINASKDSNTQANLLSRLIALSDLIPSLLL